MINNKSYNNVINTLKNIGDNHSQIATVTTGDIFDIDLAKNTKFALMHVNPVTVTTGDSSIKLQLSNLCYGYSFRKRELD
jgi:hypothetical protein